MANTRWTLSLMILALAAFGATDASALTAYVHEGPDTNCAVKTSCCTAVNAEGVNQIGAFGLNGIAGDRSDKVCRIKYGRCMTHKAQCPLTTVNARLAKIAEGPFILTGALLDDAYLTLTMPFRPAEPIS